MYNKFKPLVLLFAILCTFNLIAQESSVAGDALKSKKEIVEEAKAQVEKMSVDELKAMMEEDESFQLVDVRTEAEYLAGHIQGAKWIPRGKLEFAIQSIAQDPNAKLILYCRSGSRSALSVVSVMDMGYEKVYNLTGGFKEWTEAGNHAFNMHGEFAVIAFEKKEAKEER